MKFHGIFCVLTREDKGSENKDEYMCALIDGGDEIGVDYSTLQTHKIIHIWKQFGFTGRNFH